MHYFSGKGCSESLESMHYCIGILIKVTADLDTSQVEAKLMTLQNRKITIQANAILWILELVSYLSVLSWGISFQLVEKPAEIKLIIIPDDFRNFIDGIGCCFK